MEKLLNFEYACIHGTYWMIYGIVSSFASVFLLARGYSNSEIGIILAAANITAVVLQPVIADYADRSERISLIGITQIMTVMMMIMTLGMFGIQRKSASLGIIFVLLIAWHTVLQPLLNSLSFKLEECGIHINFGVARSIGSLAYSILMAVLGTLVERYGVVAMPVTGEIVMAMLLISLILTHKQYVKTKSDNVKKGILKQTETKVENKINLSQFICRNKIFFLVNIGVIGLYFSNSILNNYMMQIISSVGGTSEDMGRVLSIMAFLEIPTMVFFDRLRQKFTCQFMLKIAAVGFTIKIGLCSIAQSVTLIYVAQISQLVSFALFLPAMVHFIDEIMSRGEAVKGQAFFTMMITVTTIFSSVAGGIILDEYGAKVLTMIATVITAAGAAVIISTVNRLKVKS